MNYRFNWASGPRLAPGLVGLQDSIVVTAVGAEALPFLEAYGVLPLSLGFFMLFGWLVRGSVGAYSSFK